jgi:hypothetical protein
MLNKIIDVTSNKTYNVEKVKLNKLPRHFEDVDRENKIISVNGKKVKLLINRERTQYVAFSMRESNDKGVEYTQNYYVRDHSFFDEVTKVKSVIKATKVEEKVEETV